MSADPNMLALGRLLRQARGQESRAEVARRTGLGAGHLQKLEEGRLQGLTISTLTKLAQGYDTSPLTLLATALDLPAKDLDAWAQQRCGDSLLSTLSERIEAAVAQHQSHPAPSIPASPSGTLSKDLLQQRIAEWLLTVQRDSGDISLRELARRAHVPPTTVSAAATGKAGTSLLLVLFRIAEIWPGGTIDDATLFWLHGTGALGDPQALLRRSASRLDNALQDLAPLLQHIRASAAELESAADSLAHPSAPMDQLEALVLENKLLKSQLRPASPSPEMDEDALQARLLKLRQQRPHGQALGNRSASFPTSPTVED